MSEKNSALPVSKHINIFTNEEKYKFEEIKLQTSAVSTAIITDIKSAVSVEPSR